MRPAVPGRRQLGHLLRAAGHAASMMLGVDDPDAAFALAVQAGATPVYPPHDAHGWRVGHVDPYGHHWEIARPPAA